jgi:hypothetical protein
LVTLQRSVCGVAGYAQVKTGTKQPADCFLCFLPVF